MKRLFFSVCLFILIFFSAASAESYSTHSTGHFVFQANSEWASCIKDGQLHIFSPQRFSGGYIITQELECNLDGYDLDDYYYDVFIQATQAEDTSDVSIEYLTVADTKSILLTYDSLVSGDLLHVYCIVCCRNDLLLIFSFVNTSLSDDEAYQKLMQYVETISFVPSFPLSEEEKSIDVDFDLSGMSYDDLVALHDQINLAMWNSQEWQEVTVPQGLWKVGEDIPEGHWTIKPVDGVYAYVTYGNALEENGKEVAYKSKDYYHESIYSPSCRLYDEGEDILQIDIDAKAGSYIEIESGDVVFMPYTGKPKLGFK